MRTRPHRPTRHACDRIHLQSCKATEKRALLCTARADTLRNEALLRRLCARRRRHSARACCGSASPLTPPGFETPRFDEPYATPCAKSGALGSLDALLWLSTPTATRSCSEDDIDIILSDDARLDCNTGIGEDEDDTEVMDDDHEEADLPVALEADFLPTPPTAPCKPRASSAGAAQQAEPRVVFATIPRAYTHVGRLYTAVVCSRLMYGHDA